METLTYEWQWKIAKRTPHKTWLTRARFFSMQPKDRVALIRQYPPIWLEQYQCLSKKELYYKVWRRRISRCSRLTKQDLAEICAYLLL